MDLFTDLHSYNTFWCTVREEQLETNINIRDVTMMELSEHYLVWKLLLLLLSLSQMSTWKLTNVRMCQHSGDSSEKQLLALPFHHSLSSSPAHLWGPDGLCSLRDVELFTSHAESHWAQQPCCLLELDDSSAPLLFVRDLNVLVLFFLLSALFLQFSWAWISLQPFFLVSKYSHIHPH